MGVECGKYGHAIMREGKRVEGLAAVRGVRSPSSSKHSGAAAGSVGSRRSRRKPAHGRTRDGSASGGCDDGEIAVRAHEHLPQGIRNSGLRNDRPRRPKHTGTATAGEPGPRRPAMGVAGTHGGTGPDECRAQGLEGVGKNG